MCSTICRVSLHKIYIFTVIIVVWILFWQLLRHVKFVSWAKNKSCDLRYFFCSFCDVHNFLNFISLKTNAKEIQHIDVKLCRTNEKPKFCMPSAFGHFALNNLILNSSGEQHNQFYRSSFNCCQTKSIKILLLSNISYRY